MTTGMTLSVIKRTAALLLFSILFMTLSGCQLWNNHDSEDVEFQAHFRVPAIPSLQASLPSTLNISFNIDQTYYEKLNEKTETNNEYKRELPTHALRLTTDNASINKKITMAPHVDGRWAVIDDSLVFQPDLHWPANVKYTLQFSDSLFMDNIALTQSEYEFTTRGLSVSVSNSRLYVDPSKPDEHRYVSTLLFTHPIKTEEFKKHYSLFINNDVAEDTQISYTLTEDKEKNNQQKRLFHINSEQVDIGSETRYLNARLSTKFKHHLEGDVFKTSSSINSESMIIERVRIPSTDDVFHITETLVQIATNAEDEPQQVMVVEFSIPTSLEEIRKYLKIRLMPVRLKSNRRIRWNSASEITSDTEPTITNLPYTVLPTAEPLSKLFSLVFSAPDDRQVLLHAKKGLTSTAGYTTARDYLELHQAPQYPVSLSFLGEGSVLDSNGAHEIGFIARNLTDLEVKVGRVSQSDIHHLISQTGGDFKEMVLRHPLAIEDLAVITTKKFKINNSKPAKQSYVSYDLTKNLIVENEATGVFHVQAIGTNQGNGQSVRGARTILVTDIGFIAKRNEDGSREIFVQKISTQKPMNNAQIKILGRNGRTVFEIYTDIRGHAVVPDLSGLRDEKQPVALLVTKGTDLAYLPMDNVNRQLNVSRFDTGGQYTKAKSKTALSALVFVDRGIYRPGDSVKLAAIVRDGTANTTERFNVRMVISDSRGTNVYNQAHKLPADGFIEIALDTRREFNTGVYTAQLTISDGQYKNRHLGSVKFSVEEFQPDRLKIRSNISDRIKAERSDLNAYNSTIKGWLTGDELEFTISVNNLFGTAAQNRKVTASYQLNHTRFSFADYPNFSFSDVINEQARHGLQSHPALSVANTDTGGNSDIQLSLNEYFGGTYRIRLSSQGFEQNGGRSVYAENTARFSPREYLIGHKSADLHYLRQDDKRNIDFQCVNKFTQAISCPMQLNIVELNTVSTLVKQNNGTYQYQSIQQRTNRSNKAITIEAAGFSHVIDTSKAGDYELELIDNTGEVRKRVAYRVVGDKNTAAELDKDASLELSLDKSVYVEGDWVHMQIKAPYAGSGLISIESDHIHEFAWFTADSTQSTQKIRLPDGIMGNAYVQVAFIRAPSSEEVFTAPLSYAIAPFSVSKEKYEMDFTISTPTTAKPGETLKIAYQSSQPGRALIFAIDEGILQVANYENPDPLAYFLQKRALQVQTHQMFDLLLPEFTLLKTLSASGGGMAEPDTVIAGKNLNPFAREIGKPVAFWSGIVESDQTERIIEFDIPDHFDGTIRVISVALNEATFAKASSKVVVKGAFIVTPNLPTVVAPGDTFTATVGVSNQMEGSADSAMVRLSIEADENFEVIEEATQVYSIREGDEHTFTFKLRAKSNLGSADIRFNAKAERAGALAAHSRDSTTSVIIRPATLLKNTLVSGKSASTVSVISANRVLIEDLSRTTMNVSAKPSLLINGLIGYLQTYQHACTEQVVSQLSPVLTFLDHPNILGSPQQKIAKINRLFSTLRSRQLPEGGFSLWPGGSHIADLPSVNALHTLLDTQEKGIKVPGLLFDKGIRYLETLSYDPNTMERNPELAAYALYLLTRHGELTNNALIQLQTILDDAQKRKSKDAAPWQEQLVAVYIASSFKILRRDEDATNLIKQYQYKNIRKNINQYDSGLYRDAMALYLTARHFKDEIDATDKMRVDAIVDPIFNGSVNTLSAGRALIALKAVDDLTDDTEINLTLATTESTNSDTNQTQWQAIDSASISITALGYSSQMNSATSAVRISTDVPGYFQLQQTGFDRIPPLEGKSEGLEIVKQILGEGGKAMTNGLKQGDDVLIRVTVRSDSNRQHQAIAVVDLFPGGFEIDRQSVRDYQNYDVDHLDIREDRLVVYMAVGPRPTTITYKARITTSGTFTVPAVYANSMYDDRVNAYSASSVITVQAQP